jgi:PAS domain S-box-containing protein
MKVLYIEDNPFDADLTRIEMKKYGEQFQLTHVSTISEGLDLLGTDNQEHFDVVLTDMNLTDGSGLTLLAEVRNMAIPVAVVVVTGQGDEETAVAALKSGADDYIVKQKNYLKLLPQTLENAISQFKRVKNRFTRPIKVLYAEHNAVDIELTQRHIKTHAPHIQMDIVKNAVEMKELLARATAETKYDVLLIDFHLPGEDILTLVKHIIADKNFEYPIVLITGQGNEETAVSVLKLGVVDYLVKANGYLYRLPAVLENAHNLITVFHEKEALAVSEARFRLLAENASDLIFRLIFEPNPIHFDYLSPSIQQITGYSAEEVYENPNIILDASREKIPTIETLNEMLEENPSPQIIFPFITKDGLRIIIELRGQLTMAENGKIEKLEGIARDITDRIEIETKLQNRMHRLNSLHTIDTAINSSFDLRFTYQVLLEQVLALTKGNAAGISFYDPEMKMGKMINSIGFRSSESSMESYMGRDPLIERASIERRLIMANKEDIHANNYPLSKFLKEEGFINYCAVPLVVKGAVKGILEIFFKEDSQMDPEILNFLETIAQQAAIAMESTQNFERLQQTNQELLQAYDDTLAGWINFLDLRDEKTEGHTMRVVDFTMSICKTMGFSPRELTEIHRGVLLHDIGKVGIPDSILNKPGPLTEEEMITMKKHPVYAYQMLYPIAFLRPSLDIPYCHHEKWDGTGYPRGLKGKEIPLSARIFAIVDVFDALTSDRPYRKAWEVDRTIDYLRDNSGSHFDPDILELCIAVLKGS